MKFDEFDSKMRVYEESLDQIILPDIFVVARLDGRSFTKLTKDICKFEAPFDIRFRDLMVDTVKKLMESGFKTSMDIRKATRYHCCSTQMITPLGGRFGR